MHVFSNIIAEFIKIFAKMGAGVASSGFGYEPKMPESLKK